MSVPMVMTVSTLTFFFWMKWTFQHKVITLFDRRWVEHMSKQTWAQNYSKLFPTGFWFHLRISLLTTSIRPKENCANREGGKTHTQLPSCFLHVKRISRKKKENSELPHTQTNTSPQQRFRILSWKVCRNYSEDKCRMWQTHNTQQHTLGGT